MGLRIGHSNKNLVIGFYSDERQADEAIGRLQSGQFFRCASVSATDDGRRTLKRRSHAILTFAALAAAAVLIVLLPAGSYPWTYTLLGAGIAFIAGIALGPYLGFALPRKLLQEYAPRVLPGEAMVIVQCAPEDTRHLSDLLQESEEAKPVVFIVRPYLRDPYRDKRSNRELLSAEQLRLFAASCAAAQRPAPQHALWRRAIFSISQRPARGVRPRSAGLAGSASGASWKI